MQDLKNIHLAAQYLAAAGISFLEKRDDDSHTNLGYSPSDHQIRTWPLNPSKDCLALDLKDFSLKWISETVSASFGLDGNYHAQVLSWIRDISQRSGIDKAYEYKFHYKLPYDIDKDFKFKRNNEILALERKQRSLAQKTIQAVLSEYKLESEIRVWPHHFDTGALASVANNNDLTIGLGLAIPDSLVDQHYFYISGNRGHENIDPGQFEPLSQGKWISDGFKGGILASENVDEANVIDFFKQAIRSYLIE